MQIYQIDTVTLVRWRSVRAKLQFDSLSTLVSADSGIWVVLRVSSQLETIEHVSGGRLNRLLAGWLHAKQQALKNELDRANDEEIECVRSEWSFISVALACGGRSLVECYALDDESRQLIFRLEDICRRVRNEMPLSVGLIEFATVVEELGCAFQSVAA